MQLIPYKSPPTVAAKQPKWNAAAVGNAVTTKAGALMKRVLEDANSNDPGSALKLVIATPTQAVMAARAGIDFLAFKSLLNIAT